MKAATQIIACLASFLVVWVLGNFFDLAFWQAGIHARNTLNGKPLPVVTEFFVAHRHLPAHLFLFPWLGLVGAPLCGLSAARRYFDPLAFVVRYVMFLSCELALLLVLLLFLLLPFVPDYSLLEPFRQSATELIVQIVFWFAVAAVVFLGILRVYQLRKTRVV